MIEQIPSGLLSYFLYFSCAAFVGWILETAGTSVIEKRFVNAGFLTGPFIPIYGFGAVSIVVLGRALYVISPIAAWATIAVIPTALEYLTSLLLERVFGMKLWDYKKFRFNIAGRICLRFSIMWAMLAVLLVGVIHPFLLSSLSAIGVNARYFIAGALACYFVFDTVHSANAVFYFKALLADIQALVEQKKTFLPFFASEAQKRLPAELRRILKYINAFPSLDAQFRAHLTAFPDWMQDKLQRRASSKRQKKGASVSKETKNP